MNLKENTTLELIATKTLSLVTSMVTLKNLKLISTASIFLHRNKMKENE